jgi:hypothetical protein
MCLLLAIKAKSVLLAATTIVSQSLVLGWVFAKWVFLHIPPQGYISARHLVSDDKGFRLTH